MLVHEPLHNHSPPKWESLALVGLDRSNYAACTFTKAPPPSSPIFTTGTDKAWHQRNGKTYTRCGFPISLKMADPVLQRPNFGNLGHRQD
jgi:hypothetical protein